MTNENGEPLADVRVLVAKPASSLISFELDRSIAVFEGRTDAAGTYRIEVPGVRKPMTATIDAKKPGYSRYAWRFAGKLPTRDVDLKPGETTESSFSLADALYLQGVVVDELGRPLSGIDVFAGVNTPTISGGVERTATDSKGAFEIFNYPMKLDRGIYAGGIGRVYFSHLGFVPSATRSVYSLSAEERTDLRIVLSAGISVRGRLLDLAGQPAAGIVVRAYSGPKERRKAAVTDAAGQFAMQGIEPGTVEIRADAFDRNQKLRRKLELTENAFDLALELKPIDLPRDLKGVKVLGMELIDTTPEIRAAFELGVWPQVLILDPGDDSEALGIGKLSRGDSFCMVGEQQVETVREFVSEILSEASAQAGDQREVRVVYNFSNLEMDGTNTQYLVLSRADLLELQRVLSQLAGD